jgi:hypothetical protein
VPSGELVEDGGSLQPPPAERAQVGRSDLLRGGQEEPCQLAPGLLASRQPLGELPLAGEQVMGERAPGTVLIHEVGVREHEAAVQRDDGLVDVLLRSAGQLAQRRPRQRAFAADHLDELDLDPFRLVRPARSDQRRNEPRRDARRDSCDVLADADEAACGQLVLRAPEEAQLLRPPDEAAVLVAHGPVGGGVAVDLLPERGEDDVGLREEQREADLVDPLRCLRHGTDHAH